MLKRLRLVLLVCYVMFLPTVAHAADWPPALQKVIDGARQEGHLTMSTGIVVAGGSDGRPMIEAGFDRYLFRCRASGRPLYRGQSVSEDRVDGIVARSDTQQRGRRRSFASIRKLLAWHPLQCEGSSLGSKYPRHC